MILVKENAEDKTQDPDRMDPDVAPRIQNVTEREKDKEKSLKDYIII